MQTVEKNTDYTHTYFDIDSSCTPAATDGARKRTFWHLNFPCSIPAIQNYITYRGIKLVKEALHIQVTSPEEHFQWDEGP